MPVAEDALASLGVLKRVCLFLGINTSGVIAAPTTDLPSYSRHIAGTGGKTALPGAPTDLVDSDDLERAIARARNIIYTSNTRAGNFMGIDAQTSSILREADMPNFTRHLLGTDGKTALPAVSLALVDGEDLERAIARLSNVLSSSVPAGVIFPYPAAVPAGFLLCNGQEVSQATYPRLYAVIGNNYNTFRGAAAPSGGNFRVPDYRGLAMFGANASGLIQLHSTGGAETHTLTVPEIPSHTHTQNSHNHTQNAHTHGISGNNFVASNTHQSIYEGGGGNGAVHTVGYGSFVFNPATATNNAATATNQNTGGGGSHNNMPPFAGVNWIIKY